MARTSILRRMTCLFVLVAFFGTFVAPEAFAGNYYNGGKTTSKGTEGVGRALGGAAGLAAGAFGGTALAASITAAAGGALVGIPGIIVTSCVVAGLGLIGAKLGSAGGGWVDRTLGPDMTWTIFGASAGALLALMFLPLGPVAGAMAPFLKVAIGGLVGGVLGKLFAPKLQSIATPKLIFAGLGGLVGGLGFGIPGALAGVAGGYVLGGMFDKSFFTQPGRSLGEDLGVSNLFGGFGNIVNWFKNRGQDVQDWVGNSSRTFQDRMYNNVDDPYYRTARGYDSNWGYNQGNYNQYDDEHYKHGEYGWQSQTGSDQYYNDYGQGGDISQRRQRSDGAYRDFVDDMQNGRGSQGSYEDYLNFNRDYMEGRGR